MPRAETWAPRLIWAATLVGTVTFSCCSPTRGTACICRLISDGLLSLLILEKTQFSGINSIECPDVGFIYTLPRMYGMYVFVTILSMTCSTMMSKLSS